MIKHKWIGFLSALLMAASVVFIGIGYFAPWVFESITGAAQLPYAAAMDKNKVLDIEIIADEKDWESMLENAMSEEYISATVIIDGVKISNVGVRPKGNSSLSMVAQDDTTDRYSFKIEFDHYVSGQTWLGLDKIVVNNMQGDSTYMKEYLSYDIMAYAGVETPLYSFSNISVNGETWGLYLAIEALEDSYAVRVYGNDHGKLYKPESMNIGGGGRANNFPTERRDNVQEEGFSQQEGGGRAGQPEFAQGNLPNEGAVSKGGLDNDKGFSRQENSEEQKSPDENQDQFFAGGDFSPGFGGGLRGGSGGSTLKYTDDEISSYSDIFENDVFKTTDKDYARVINALKKLNEGEDLESVVDVEATLKYFAAHTVIVNLDSYVSNMSHNYYLYEKDGQLTMLPWDFNLAFGGFQSGSASSVVNFPIDTPVSGVSLEDRPMLGKLLEVPQYMELYHSYLRQIIEGYFNSGVFTQTINSLDDLISSYIEADPTAFYDFASYEKGVVELEKLGTLRAKSIEGQLDGTIPSTTEGQSLNSEALIDASSIDLSALGSMGGGFGGGQGKDGGNRSTNGMGGGFEPENMQKMAEIFAAAQDGELTAEQSEELLELGFTEEQIAMFKDRAAESFPVNMGKGMNNSSQGKKQNGEVSQPSSALGFDMWSCVVLVISAVLLSGGILFVVFYKRRKPV